MARTVWHRASLQLDSFEVVVHRNHPSLVLRDLCTNLGKRELRSSHLRSYPQSRSSLRSLEACHGAALAALVSTHGHNGPRLNFYGTHPATAGSSYKAADELRARLPATAVTQVPGRTYFSMDATLELESLTSLKCFERICLAIAHTRIDGLEDQLADPVQLSTDKEEALAEIIAFAVTSVPWEQRLNELRFLRAEPGAASSSEAPRIGYTFKVKCKRSGHRSRHVTSQEVEAAVGGALQGRGGLCVDVRNPDILVLVAIGDNHWGVGIPLLQQAATDSWIVAAGLHPMVAWALARAAGIQEGERVCDPMCGAGIVIGQAAQDYPQATFLGFDKDAAQLERCSCNLQKVIGRAVRVLRGRVRRRREGLVRASPVDICTPSVWTAGVATRHEVTR
ncbi:hypothetical protein CYMTET_50515 [Cymbomonas tetramitiformis]|uniref:THUMP domain-containing protein n=1 Tax=Cymbomonas tetramitiformis TaxID=36881 RepID=A0AAE0BP42_9CHLO|nr:hypothetical protein CYMTET_50515 [Cymbomonas tetramitiformis]